jgi:hypothetical protein
VNAPVTVAASAQTKQTFKPVQIGLGEKATDRLGDVLENWQPLIRTIALVIGFIGIVGLAVILGGRIGELSDQLEEFTRRGASSGYVAEVRSRLSTCWVLLIASFAALATIFVATCSKGRRIGAVVVIGLFGLIMAIVVWSRPWGFAILCSAVLSLGSAEPSADSAKALEDWRQTVAWIGVIGVIGVGIAFGVSAMS